MMKIEELTEEDIVNNTNVFLAVGEIYGEYYGEYYKFIEDGITKFIHRIYNEDRTQSALTILTLEDDNTISGEQFNVDEDYNIVRAGFEDYVVTYYEDDIVVEDKNTGMTSSVKFRERPNGEDRDGYTGMVVYSQVNEETDERCILTYQQMYNDFNLINESNTKVPFLYQIEKNVLRNKILKKVRTYGTDFYDFRTTPDLFNIVTIKEYGLITFLKNGAYDLQKTDKIKRCLRLYWTNKAGASFTGFPFSRIYSVEEIESQIKEKGFNIEIPHFLIELYNNEHKEMKRYEEIASLMKTYCSNIEDEQKLILTREVFSNEDEEN